MSEYNSCCNKAGTNQHSNKYKHSQQTKPIKQKQVNNTMIKYIQYSDPSTDKVSFDIHAVYHSSLKVNNRRCKCRRVTRFKRVLNKPNYQETGALHYARLVLIGLVAIGSQLLHHVRQCPQSSHYKCLDFLMSGCLLFRYLSKFKNDQSLVKLPQK